MSKNEIIRSLDDAEDPRVVKLANVEDEATGNAYEEFEFTKVRKRTGKISIPRNEARDPAKVRDLLIAKNADLPFDKDESEKIVARATKMEPQRYLTCAAQIGLRKIGRAFVLPDRVVTEPGWKTRLLPPLWVNDRQLVRLGRRGKLKGWKKSVAKPAQFSTRLMLTISAAFAAPLVSQVSLQPFGLNIYGRSKVGKTTAFLAGTSVIGIGRESELPNWNRTEAASLEAARVLNNLLLGVNEVGLIAGKRGDAYQHIREYIYRFAEGRDRARHSGSAYATAGANATWTGIFVSTSEHSFNAYAAFSGEERDHGELARCLDVAATNRRDATIFDRKPKSVDAKDFDRWAKAAVIKVRHACERHHGVAIKPYLQFLFANREDLATSVKARTEEFVKAVAVPNEDGALQHAARNLGTVYAGGCIGIDAGLLPWKPARLLSAIVNCFKDGLNDLKLHQNVEQQALETLRKRLQGASIAHRKTKSTFGPDDYDGYREVVDGRTEYAIKATAFCAWLPFAIQQIAAMKWLMEEGHLKPGKKFVPSSLAIGGKIEPLAQQRRWPNGKNPRCFVFSDPVGNDDG
jgi:putative DNA primase/helicase